MTEKQKLFCLEFIKSKNATRSAIKAGYSKKTAAFIGSENLKKPYIKKFIAERLKKQADRIELSADNVLEEYRRLAFSNLTDYTDKDGKIDAKTLKSLPREISAAIASLETEKREFETGTVTNTKFKLFNKIAALDALARHFGLFETDNLQKQPVVKIGFSDEEDEDQ